MHFFSQVVRRSRSGARISIGLSLPTISICIAWVFVAEAAFGQLFQARPRRAQVAGQEASPGVYLPTDRSLSRAIARARERLAEREYHEVLAFLQGILSRDEDSFLERVGEDRQQLGLKATARQLIGELPPEGHDAYELLHGATARRQLEAALRAGDREALAKVVRQFFHTSAGYEASLVLAEMEADQGHRLAAAALYRELIETPRAAARLEPQLSVAAALNLLAASQKDDAAEIIRALAKNKPSAQVTLSGKAAPLPSATADVVGWLTSLVGQPQAAMLTNLNWLTLHGDPARNSQTSGGRPHLRPRWEARVINDPSVEAYLSGRNDDFIQRGVVAIPGARPIAVGDIVVMRTPENIVAVEWQSGKRIWESRDEEELQSDLIASEPMPGIDRDQWAAQGRPLEERVWDDALMTSLSSDGKHVFVVRGQSTSRDDDQMQALQPQMFGRNGIESSVATNQLAAYDIDTQGKLAWELDGSRSAGKLAGAFFLGAPLAIDNTLYVMAEMRSALYLIALDPATGQVQWQQQLIGLEQGITLDPARRRAGAMPSYSGGVLVCPTAASTVVAIDAIKREFAWVYKYPREASSVPDMRNFWPQQPMQPQLVRANNQWLDSSAVIAEGHVLLTPPDSSEIHCVDLHSGKQAWKRLKGDSLFVGSVGHGRVLLIGGQSVQALRLADGEPAWENETLPLPSGALPAGQGYVSDGLYYLPLTSGQIAEIDMAEGKLITFTPSAPNLALGNLICHRGSVLSQSALVLDKFEQLSVLRKRTETALAHNPDDPTAVRESAELKRSDNQKSEAVKLLKRAYELAPDDLVTQEMLVELLLEQLASDYKSFRSDVPLVAKLIHNREQQIDLLRIDAAGLDASGDRLAAWDAYLRLADFTAEEPAPLRIDERYTVRSDRWISGRLKSLWDGASADDRQTIESKLASRRPNLKNPRTAAEMRHYLAHLEHLPGASEVRLALTSYLIEHDRPQEAELEVLESLAKDDSSVQAAATDQMAKLTSLSNLSADRPRPRWPRGHVDEEITSAAASATPRDPISGIQREQKPGFRQLRIEQDFWPPAAPMQWFISADCSELIGRSMVGDDAVRLTVPPNSLTRQYRDSNLVHGARLGHLLFVNIGGQPIAVDSRLDRSAQEAEVLWPTSSQEGMTRDPSRPRRGPVTTRGRTNRPPLYHTYGRKRLAGAGGAALGSLGPVTPRGVVFQDENELKCVDPLTGVTLWSRTDIPIGCELFGDDEFVLAADSGNKVAYAVRLIDGQLLEKRDCPKSEWLMTAGRNVAQLGSGMSRSGRYVLSVTDIWEQKTFIQFELPNTARISLIEPDAVAAFEHSGHLRVIDVRSGQLVIDQKIDAVSDAQAIHTMRSGDDLFVFVTSPVPQQFRPIVQSFDYPMINGPVYAFSMETGKPLWPGPAIVRNRGIFLAQPADIPFLVFADRQTMKEAAATGNSQIRVVCIDKRTGETVYRNEHVPDTLTTRFRIRAENELRPLVSLEMGAAKIQLTMTDRPRPPQPPANDDLEASRDMVERGLQGLGIKALRGALERSSSPAPADREKNKPAQQGDETKPAKDADTDDD